MQSRYVLLEKKLAEERVRSLVVKLVGLFFICCSPRDVLCAVTTARKRNLEAQDELLAVVSLTLTSKEKYCHELKIF